jgi:hypothetical protein
MPRALGAGGGIRAAFDNPLEAEILAEKAAGLSRTGRKVETALAALAEVDRDAPGRDAALRAAADAVYSYFIQRELCGFGDHRSAIELYSIPREVLARVGAR